MQGKLIHNYNKSVRNEEIITINKSIYWGEVISIDDNIDGGGIRVRISGLDNNLLNEELPFAYPLVPKFLHVFPKKGEVVRVFIENIKYPQRSRLWEGPIISQPHKINYDNLLTALSTTNLGVSKPDEKTESFPDAEGVYPKKNDIALLGRLNNDVILRDNEVELRAGKHVNENNLKLNRKNVGSVRVIYEDNEDGTYRSSTIIQSDVIALISHKSTPKFKSFGLTKKDRDYIFEKASPIAKGNLTIAALELMRKAILEHIHPYSKLPADPNGSIVELRKLDFNIILNKNIVTN